MSKRLKCHATLTGHFSNCFYQLLRIQTSFKIQFSPALKHWQTRHLYGNNAIIDLAPSWWWSQVNIKVKTIKSHAGDAENILESLSLSMLETHRFDRCSYLVPNINLLKLALNIWWQTFCDKTNSCNQASSLVERVRSHVRLVRTGQSAALKFFKQRRCCIKRLAKLPQHVFLKSFHTVERVFALQLIWIRNYIVILIVYHCIVILTCIILSYYRHVSLYPNVHMYLVS